MSQMDAPAQFVLKATPTEADYRHAMTAHGAWAQVQPFRGVRGKLKLAAWIAPMLIFLAVPKITELMGFTDVRINLGALLSVAAIPLVITLWLITATMMKQPKPPPPELIEHPLDQTGQTATRRPSPRNNVLGWVLFIGLAVMMFLLINKKAPNVRGPGGAAASPTAAYEDAEGEELMRVPGTLFFVCTIGFSFMLLGIVFNAFRRQDWRIKDQLKRLSVPRTWEASEHGLTEASANQTIAMKWEYFRKFLETPQVIMLYPDDYQYYVIPRSAFSDDGQYERFIGLLMSKVPNGIMQPRPTRGFAVQPLATPST